MFGFLRELLETLSGCGTRPGLGITKKGPPASLNCPTHLPAMGPSTDGLAACQCEGSLKADLWRQSQHIWIISERISYVSLGAYDTCVLQQTVKLQRSQTGWTGQRSSMLIPDLTPFSPYRLTQTSLAYL